MLGLVCLCNAIQEEYEEMCQKVIDEAEAADSVAAVISSPKLLENKDGDEESQKGIDIGRFKNCVHHEDGLQSTIYKSKTDGGRLVALKVTTPHLMTAPHDSKREVRILREAASDHVITLLESFTLGGRLILVFPFMKHVFADLLRGDILTAAQIKSHLCDLFRALSHIHSCGIIHRDVKPSNILLASPAGPAYLADFGIAWKDGDPDSEPPDQKIIDVGTTCYRPPEILFGSTTYGMTFDLWSAGCVVAEAIDVGHKQLFDSGPLGSELSLISSIFKTLGTPNERTWPVRALIGGRNENALLTFRIGVRETSRLGENGVLRLPPKDMGRYLKRRSIQGPRSSKQAGPIREQPENLCYRGMKASMPPILSLG